MRETTSLFYFHTLFAGREDVTRGAKFFGNSFSVVMWPLTPHGSFASEFVFMGYSMAHAVTHRRRRASCRLRPRWCRLVSARPWRCISSSDPERRECFASMIRIVWRWNRLGVRTRSKIGWGFSPLIVSALPVRGCFGLARLAPSAHFGTLCREPFPWENPIRSGILSDCCYR